MSFPIMTAGSPGIATTFAPAIAPAMPMVTPAATTVSAVAPIVQAVPSIGAVAPSMPAYPTGVVASPMPLSGIPMTAATMPSPSKPRVLKASAPQGYTQIQYIALEICTMPHGFNTSSTVKDDWYIGQSNIPLDIQMRVRLMGEALERVYNDPAIDRSPTTLKLVMAPEFLFRGPKGAYSLKQILGPPDSPGSLEGQLASLVLDGKWRNWLAIFGTTVGYKKMPDAAKPYFEVYNISMIQEGGYGTLAEAANHATVIIKQDKSGIDFLGDPRFGGLANGQVKHALQPVELLQVQNDPDSLDVDDDGIFSACGITFGLEICLDHALKKLKMTSKKPGENMMQVQLVPSGGMTVQPEAICVQPGGLVFHCDGLTNATSRSYGAHSSAWSLGPSGLAQCQAQSKGSLFGQTWQQKTQGLYWQGFEPTFSIHPPLPLPAPIQNQGYGLSATVSPGVIASRMPMSGTAPMVQYAAAPMVAPPIVEYTAPQTYMAPAVEYVAPSPVVEYAAPMVTTSQYMAPAVEYVAPSPVVEYVAPAATVLPEASSMVVTQPATTAKATVKKPKTKKKTKKGCC